MSETAAVLYDPPSLSSFGPLHSRDITLSPVALSPTEASAEFISTTARNHIGLPSLVSGAVTCASGRTVISPGATVTADADGASITIGEACVIDTGAIVRPATDPAAGEPVAMLIADMTIIEEGCLVEAASLGALCHIMHHSVIGPRAVLAPCVRVLPHSRVPAGFTAPPFAILGGNPARIVGTLPPSAAEGQRKRARAEAVAAAAAAGGAQGQA